MCACLRILIDIILIAAGKSGGMKAVLDNLTELWDESQYNEEYSLSSFLKGLK